MSFESVYRSKNGAIEIDKVTTMIGSLVIKNEYEAQVYETSESLSNYILYHGAYTKTDTFADYTLDDRRLYKDYVYEYMRGLSRNYVFTMSSLNTMTESRSSVLNEKYHNKVQEVIDYLSALRFTRLFLYDEKNLYYRQFLGKPEPSDIKIPIQNFDAGDDGYIEITDLSLQPIQDIEYFTKIIDETGITTYKSLGFLSSWYDENYEQIADNFYFVAMIYVEDLKKNLYPKTYNYYILQKHIDKIIEQYPTKYYLRFIGKEYTPFYLRKLANYSIIQYDETILNGTEQSYFFKSYDKARKQVVLDYIKGFDSKQPLYNLLMIENLLYYTVINYSASYIERYSLGIYTETNCNDILDSYGYSSLKKISNLDLKQRIVRNINELTANKGSNYVLDIIMNKILQDPNSELKRYYLEKEYSTSSLTGEIKINTAAGLEDSVQLILREVPALNITELSSSSDKYHNYDSFVIDDNLWGGVNETDSLSSKLTKKEVLKKKLLSSNFNSILTKYITLTRSIDILESQSQLRDLLYLMLRWFGENNSESFFNTRVTFENFTATPAAVFAMICWLQQMKFYKDPDTIIYDNCVINSSVVFRRMGLMSVDVNQLENNMFIIDGKPVAIYDISPEIMSWKVLDFIKENPDVIDENVIEENTKEFLRLVINSTDNIPTSLFTDRYEDSKIVENGILQYGYIQDGIKHLDIDKENIEDYLTRFRFFNNGIDLGEINSNTTFGDLVMDYKNQYPNLIKRITEKMQQSYDYREFQAWCYMLEQCRTDNSIAFIFKNYDKFSNYIASTESDSIINYVFSKLHQYIPTQVETYSYEPSINAEDYYKIHNTRYRLSDICAMQEEITGIFRDWVTTSFSDLIYGDNSEDSESSSYIGDMKLLFDEFLSVFTQLYSVDYNYSFGDKSYDGLYLQLFYNPLNIYMADKYKDFMELIYTEKIKFKDFDSFIIELNDYIVSKEKKIFADNINNELIYDNEISEFVKVNNTNTPNVEQKYYTYENDEYVGPITGLTTFEPNKEYYIKVSQIASIIGIEDQFEYKENKIKCIDNISDHFNIEGTFTKMHSIVPISDSLSLSDFLK